MKMLWMASSRAVSPCPVLRVLALFLICPRQLPQLPRHDLEAHCRSIGWLRMPCPLFSLFSNVGVSSSTAKIGWILRGRRIAQRVLTGSFGIASSASPWMNLEPQGQWCPTANIFPSNNCFNRFSWEAEDLLIRRSLIASNFTDSLWYLEPRRHSRTDLRRPLFGAF